MKCYKISKRRQEKWVRYDILVDENTLYCKDVNFFQLVYKFNVILILKCIKIFQVNLLLTFSKGIKAREG